MNFNITEAAIKRLKFLIKNREDNKKIFRVALDPGGCSGFQYKYEFIEQEEPTDFILSIDEVKICIDDISSKLLENCSLNFIEELGKSYFEVQNPVAKNKCGSGNAFNI